MNLIIDDDEVTDESDPEESNPENVVIIISTAFSMITRKSILSENNELFPRTISPPRELSLGAITYPMQKIFRIGFLVTSGKIARGRAQKATDPSRNDSFLRQKNHPISFEPM